MFDSLLNPPVLFFFLGLFATTVRSDLHIPEAVSKLLSMYLLLSIGFRGGVELSHSGVTLAVAEYLGAALLLAVVTPLWVFFAMRRWLGAINGAAVAATYGSVSAITFIAAVAFLDKAGEAYGGYAVAALALMESPAIIIGVMLARFFQQENSGGVPWKSLLHDACLNGSVLLLLGSFIIGLTTGSTHWKSLEPFVSGNFSGLLAFFLLDMGLLAGRHMGELRRVGLPALFGAVVVPLVNATVAIALAAWGGFSVGDSLLLTTLAASASYIAVPAALRLALPEANAGVYLPMALALTFPFNVVVGIPLYHAIIRALWNTT